MFKCEISGKMSRLGEKINRIVVERREKVYYESFRNEETGRWEEKEVGRGWEIVKELQVSEAGLKIWNSLQATSA